MRPQSPSEAPLKHDFVTTANPLNPTDLMVGQSVQSRTMQLDANCILRAWQNTVIQVPLSSSQLLLTISSVSQRLATSTVKHICKLSEQARS